jgi:hypothetical protein
MKNPIPRYKHDCKACQFIGCLQEFDIYACPQGGNPTIVARFSSKGPDYFSGHPLHVAGLHIHLSIGWLSDAQVRS